MPNAPTACLATVITLLLSTSGALGLGGVIAIHVRVPRWFCELVLSVSLPKGAIFDSLGQGR